MIKPTRLVLDDGGYFRQGIDVAIAGIGFLTFFCGVVLFTTEATLGGLLLPFAGPKGAIIILQSYHPVAHLLCGCNIAVVAGHAAQFQQADGVLCV